MRFVYGPIPENGAFDPEREGWTPLRQPTPCGYTLRSAALAAPISVGVWVYLDGIRSLLRSDPTFLVLLVLLLLALLPVHEMFHVIAFRNWLRDPQILMGLWPRVGMWVCYDAPQPRNRMLGMLLAPLFSLSVFPLTLLLLFPANEWARFFGLIALIHLAACTGDIQTFCRVLRQVPAEALIQNKGWQTYWRVP